MIKVTQGEDWLYGSIFNVEFEEQAKIYDDKTTTLTLRLPGEFTPRQEAVFLETLQEFLTDAERLIKNIVICELADENK